MLPLASVLTALNWPCCATDRRPAKASDWDWFWAETNAEVKARRTSRPMRRSGLQGKGNGLEVEFVMSEGEAYAKLRLASLSTIHGDDEKLMS